MLQFVTNAPPQPEDGHWVNRTGILIADAVFTLVTGVWSFAEPLLDDKRTALLVTAAAVAAGAGLTALSLTAVRQRRRGRSPGRAAAIVGAMALVLVALGAGAGYFGQQLSTRVGPPVVIYDPKDGTTAYPDQDITLAVTYSVVRPAAELCDGHLWLIDREPSGWNGQELYVARQELPCDKGKAQVRFPISTKWLPHVLTVYRLDDTDQQWALDNNRAWRTHDWSNDGRFVTMPVSASIESDDVHIVRAP